MATEIEGIKMARPMTHDLLKTILGEVGCSVESVEITELKENTYYAAVNLKLAGRQMMIDSRPSDAIALALRTKSPIYVAKAVLEASSMLQQNEEGNERAVENVSNVSKEKWAEILRKDGAGRFQVQAIAILPLRCFSVALVFELEAESLFELSSLVNSMATASKRLTRKQLRQPDWFQVGLDQRC